MLAPFNRFEIQMTAAEAASATQPGKDALEDVRALLRQPKIARQFRKISDDAIRAELKEYGTWDAAELADTTANRERILWLAAGNITDEIAQRGRGRGRGRLGGPSLTAGQQVHAAVRAGDCAGAAALASRAVRAATTPQQRAAAGALQRAAAACRRR